MTITTTITLRADAKYGYGGRQYIAQITGRAPKVTFARQFVGIRYGKRNEETEHITDEVGLYELCNIDRKGNKDQRYRLVLSAPAAAEHRSVAEDAEEEERVDVAAESRAASEDLTVVRVDRSQAMAIAKRLDKGESLADFVRVAGEDEITILTAAQARKAAAAANVDEAVAACLAVLGSLPEREAKRVVSELRKRLSAKASGGQS